MTADPRRHITPAGPGAGGPGHDDIAAILATVGAGCAAELGGQGIVLIRAAWARADSVRAPKGGAPQPGAGRDAGRPSSLAMNPRNREASADRRGLLLAAFRTLDDTTQADLLEAVESLASRATGVDSERDEARTIIHQVYTVAGWDDGRARS